MERSGHFLTLQEGPGPPKSQKPILSGNKAPICSKHVFVRIFRPARPEKCCFGKIWLHIFWSMTSKVHGSRAAPLNGQNEGRIFEKPRIFRVCFRRQADRHTDRGQTGPASPPPTHPVGGLCTPPLQQSADCCRRRKMATSSFSASALAWDVPGTHLAPCVLWLLGPPGRPHGPLQGGYPRFLR